MSKRLAFGLSLALLALFAATVSADSPLTSTDFHTAYLDVEMVKTAKDAGVMSQAIADYLANNKNALDLKAAVINALGWELGGKKNADYFARLAFHQPLATLNRDKLDVDALFCLGYLQALDDYFAPQKALPDLDKAAALKPHSQTIGVIRALVQAQIKMDSQSAWRELGRTTLAVLDDHALTDDALRPAALKIIRDYMALYAE